MGKLACCVWFLKSRWCPWPRGPQGTPESRPALRTREGIVDRPLLGQASVEVGPGRASPGPGRVRWGEAAARTHRAGSVLRALCKFWAHEFFSQEGLEFQIPGHRARPLGFCFQLPISRGPRRWVGPLKGSDSWRPGGAQAVPACLLGHLFLFFSRFIAGLAQWLNS